MRFDVGFVPSADEDLDHYETHQQRIILTAIATLLSVDAHVPSKRRKRLRSNPLAPWELRVGEFRVFYEVREGEWCESWPWATRNTTIFGSGGRR
jgi:mRNA interferase RelE/StbE